MIGTVTDLFGQMLVRVRSGRDRYRGDGVSCMTSLVKKTYAEWTDGLDTRQSMISIFTHIRNIPYSLSLPIPDPQTSMEHLLITGKGSCGPKHYLLAEMFRRLNLNTVYATIAFSWNDPDLHYPPDLRDLAARLSIAHHLACRVQVGCRWVLVDATWDPPLAKGGFPINDHWDGYSEMKWAVKPCKSSLRPNACTELNDESDEAEDRPEPGINAGERDHWDLEDMVRYYRETIAVRASDQVMWKAQFYRKFENWLDDLRKNSHQI